MSLDKEEQIVIVPAAVAYACRRETYVNEVVRTFIEGNLARIGSGTAARIREILKKTAEETPRSAYADRMRAGWLALSEGVAGIAVSGRSGESIVVSAGVEERVVVASALRWLVRAGEEDASVMRKWLAEHAGELDPGTTFVVARDIREEFDLDRRCEDVVGWVRVDKAWEETERICRECRRL